MFQQLTIIGNLGRDPELRYLPNGDAVCNLSVAASDGHKDATGQWVKKTTWFRVTVWGKTAENANQYLTKGRLVLVVGTLKSDANGNPAVFARKDGTTGASFEVNGHTLKFIGAGQPGGAGGDQPQPVAASPDPDEIPF